MKGIKTGIEEEKTMGYYSKVPNMIHTNLKNT